MAAQLKPYPAYKDSGVSWLGEVPAHWEEQKQAIIPQVVISQIDVREAAATLPEVDPFAVEDTLDDIINTDAA